MEGQRAFDAVEDNIDRGEGQRAFDALEDNIDRGEVVHHFQIPTHHYTTPHGYDYPPTRVPNGGSAVLHRDGRMTRYYVHSECGTFNNFSVAAIRAIIDDHGGRPYADPRPDRRPHGRNSVFVIGDNPAGALIEHIERHNLTRIGYAVMLREVIAAVGENENENERFARESARAFREAERIFRENQEAQHNEEAEDSEEDSEEEDD